MVNIFFKEHLLVSAFRAVSECFPFTHDGWTSNFAHAGLPVREMEEFRECHEAYYYGKRGHQYHVQSAFAADSGNKSAVATLARYC